MRLSLDWSDENKVASASPQSLLFLHSFGCHHNRNIHESIDKKWLFEHFVRQSQSSENVSVFVFRPMRMSALYSLSLSHRPACARSFLLNSFTAPTHGQCWRSHAVHAWFDARVYWFRRKTRNERIECSLNGRVDGKTLSINKSDDYTLWFDERDDTIEVLHHSSAHNFPSVA